MEARRRGAVAVALRIEVVGVNHRTAPIAVREVLAFDGDAAAQTLAAFHQRWPLAEGLLVSTCNRVEFYVAAEGSQPDARALMEFLAVARALTVDQFADVSYGHSGRAAARHLFSVVSGLDSQVVGESQIAGQVKGAYLLAARAGITGPVLNQLFQRSFRVGKRVRRSTGIARHPVSVGSVAAAFAARIFESVAPFPSAEGNAQVEAARGPGGRGAEGRVVLMIGAGETAESTVRHLRTVGAWRLLVANRTAARAADLARRHGGQAVPFEAVTERLAEADIVITSTSAPDAILTAPQVREAVRRRRRAHRHRPIFVIDLAVPRNVDPSVNDLDDVYLYNIDDLERVCEANRRQRRRQVAAGLALVDGEADAFVAWLQALAAGPVIRALRRRLHEVGQEEVRRLLNRLDHPTEQDRQEIELMVRRLVNKLAHRPVTALRRAAARGRALTYLSIVRELFGLEEDLEAEDENGPSVK